MKNIYLVMWGEYSDTSVDKVFTSEKKAKNYIKEQKEKKTYDCESLRIDKRNLR